MPYVYGYNMEVVYDQDSGSTAFAYLGERLLKSSFKEDHFFGGSCRMIFKGSAENETLTYRIEPRLNQHDATKIFLHMNRDFRLVFLPKRKIKNALEEVWEKSHTFINQVEQWGK